MDSEASAPLESKNLIAYQMTHLTCMNQAFLLHLMTITMLCTYQCIAPRTPLLAKGGNLISF